MDRDDRIVYGHALSRELAAGPTLSHLQHSPSSASLKSQDSTTSDPLDGIAPKNIAILHAKAAAAQAQDERHTAARTANGTSNHKHIKRFARKREDLLSAASKPSPDNYAHQRGPESEVSYSDSISSGNHLTALQERHDYSQDGLTPVNEDDPRNFDLVHPAELSVRGYSLEERSELLFSIAHLKEIFNDPNTLMKFTNYLSSYRPKSIPLLVYYLDALKALRAIKYANSLSDNLESLRAHDFSLEAPPHTANGILEDKAEAAFEALVRDELPSYITHTFIKVVTVSIQQRVTGTLPSHLREASEGLAEVFCLSDPSRTDNPIVFASEEFHRTSQYGVSYAIGRNCRFLQGPRTNPFSTERLKKAIVEGREISEVLLNYRRDGSPFMNLLMIAPLMDSKGAIRYFIGAQVDISGLVKECSELEGMKRLVAKLEQKEGGEEVPQSYQDKKSEIHQLSEMLTSVEVETIRKFGGKMVGDTGDDDSGSDYHHASRPRLLLKDPSQEGFQSYDSSPASMNGRLNGVYKHYLLVRPHPSLRILFVSPSLRTPGILQSPLLSRIGGSQRVHQDLVAALAEGRGVTAKVRWVSGRSSDEEGRPRWMHCTPLLGHSGAVGVWMIVLVDEANSSSRYQYRMAPPVARDVSSKPGTSSSSGDNLRSNGYHRPITAGSTSASWQAGTSMMNAAYPLRHKPTLERELNGARMGASAAPNAHQSPLEYHPPTPSSTRPSTNSSAVPNVHSSFDVDAHSTSSSARSFALG